MKAVIAVPPVLDFYYTPSRTSALGAGAVEDILNRFGISSTFLNFPLSGKKPFNLPLPSELSHLKEHLIPEESGPVSFFTVFKRFGPSISECAEQILRHKPDIVFISSFAWAYADETVNLASTLKKLKPHLPIAAGGAAISVNPSFFRACAPIDYVLPGEAEEVLPEFLQQTFGMEPKIIKEDNTPGFYIRETGISYKKRIRFYSSVVSRGCPKGCRFCSNHLVHGRKFRKASVKDISDKINAIPDDLNIHLNFEDDNLMLDRDFFFDVIDIVKRRFPEATFTSENGLDYTLLDENLVSMLTKTGFRSFNFSMASADQSLLKNQNRIHNPERLKTVLEAAKAGGAASTTYFICGLEGDSIESVIENLTQLHGLPTLTGISLFYPVPGLEGYSPERMSEYPPRLCAGSSAWPWNGSLSTTQMVTSFRLARLSNLIKTLEKRIRQDNRSRIDEPSGMLVKKISETGRLYSFIRKEPVQIPNQSEELVEAFLNRINL